ncbi:MAG: rhodanese-like domain-containing protein [Ignavibacteria bacterium]|nr:rhodanese-like domain-containing protein [Ignavibacteria bacterium]
MKKLVKESIVILVIVIIFAVIGNILNPKGISLFPDESRYKIDSTSSGIDYSKVWNDPYDTTSNKVAILSGGETTKEGYIKPQNINLVQAKTLYDINGLFIDGRKREEYEKGHIKGAINIPYEEFMKLTVDERKEMMRKYNKNGVIVCYCEGGGCDVSIDLGYEIAKIGFNSVNIYLGGYSEWKAKGYPIEEK